MHDSTLCFSLGNRILGMSCILDGLRLARHSKTRHGDGGSVYYPIMPKVGRGVQTL